GRHRAFRRLVQGVLRSGMSADALLHKIDARTAKVGVIGLGYVGLPLVLLFEESGFPVLGFDVDAAKTEALARGESYIRHRRAAWPAAPTISWPSRRSARIRATSASTRRPSPRSWAASTRHRCARLPRCTARRSTMSCRSGHPRWRNRRSCWRTSFGP